MVTMAAAFVTVAVLVAVVGRWSSYSEVGAGMVGPGVAVVEAVVAVVPWGRCCCRRRRRHRGPNRASLPQPLPLFFAKPVALPLSREPG